MNFSRLKKAAGIFSLIVCITACTDISGRELGSGTDGAGGNGPSGEEYKTYVFSESEEEFIKNACFVGDSLALGLGRELGYNVIGDVDLTPSNIGEFVMKNGLDVKTALINSDAPTVVFFMKADSDSADELSVFIGEMRAFLPETEFFALYAPPLTDFADAFNESLKSKTDIRSADINTELKNDGGRIKSLYTDEYGELTAKAYQAALWKLADSAR